MSHGNTLVIVPTYNEVDNLERVLSEVRGALPDAAVLVVDDASPDRTGELADRLAAGQSGLFVLHRSGKNGLGSAYVEGFQWALERGYRIVIEMDADGSHPAAVLPEMVAALKRDSSLGVSIGSRWVPGGSVSNWSKFRVLLSSVANRYAGFMLGMPVKDSTSGFRAWRREALEAIDLTSVKSRGYCFQIDMTERALRAGWGAHELPITFKEREFGRSKMSFTIALEAMWFVTFGGIRRLARKVFQRRT